jgi:hypothetical protein
MNLLTSIRLLAPSPFPHAAVPPRTGERSHTRGAVSTKALSELPFYRKLRRGAGRAAYGVGGFVRASGIRDQWRFLVLWTLLSFATAWLGTRALMTGFEASWTAAALSVASHENQELRLRQETLREATEAAQARLAALEPTLARTP